MMSADGLAPCLHRLVNHMSGVQEKTCSEQGGRSARCGRSAWEVTGNWLRLVQHRVQDRLRRAGDLRQDLPLSLPLRREGA